MKLRAKQDTQIYTVNGLVFVKGPELSPQNEQLVPGELADVADDFVVNPNVWEVVKPPADGRAVEYVEFDDDGNPKKRVAKKPEKPQPAGGAAR